MNLQCVRLVLSFCLLPPASVSFAPGATFSYTLSLFICAPNSPGRIGGIFRERSVGGFSQRWWVMFELPNDQTTVGDRAILRKLRVWIVALAAACLLAGIGLGAMLSGRPTVAQNEAQISRAPEALSASFAEIARRVEPAVVNIETMTAAPEVAARDNDDKE